MSKKRHTITMPGIMLDSIRDNGNYDEDDKRFKRQRIKGPSVLHRKENRKQQRQEKKNQKNKITDEYKNNFKQKQKEYLNNKKGKKNNKKSNTQNKKTVVIKADEAHKEKKQKRVSFCEHDEIREIPARESSKDVNIDLDFEKWEKEFASDSEDSEQDFSPSDDDLQDEEDEENAQDLIQTLKQLKQVQRGEFQNEDATEDDDEEEEEEEEEEDIELDDEQLSIMEELAKLKGKRLTSNIPSDIRIVKEQDLEDDSDLSDEIADDNDDDDDSDDEGQENDNDDLDKEQQDIMSQLAALKAKKTVTSQSKIRIVKEDDLDDDVLSGDDVDESDKSEEEELQADELAVLNQLKALKGKRNKDTSVLKIVKEDELSDDSPSEDDASEEEEEEEEEEEGEEEEEEEEEEGEEEEEEEALDEEQNAVMNELAKLKGNKKGPSSTLKIVKEDDLNDDSLSEEEEIVSDNGSDNEYDVRSINSRDDEDINYYSKKLGINPKKGLKRQNEDDFVGGLFEGLDFMDAYDNLTENDQSEAPKTTNKAEKASENKGKESTDKNATSKKIISDHDREMFHRDDADIDYYAKKLGINPKKGISKQNDDDIIGGLFDGLNLDFGDDGTNDEAKESFLDSDSDSELDNDAKHSARKADGEDDDIDSDDFDDDDDLDEDDKALLKEMYGLESSDSEYESDSESDDGPRIKENPYMAPVDAQTDTAPAPAGSKYIPPALRKKMAMGENTEDNETMQKLMRLIKGPFNKLSEPNILGVVSELNEVYNDNPRQFVNEAILKVVLQSVAISTPMLESFLVLYSSAIVALYKLQGVEFGAFVIQKVVEEFEKEIDSTSRTKQEMLNVTGLLGYLYTLNLVSATLIYDIIKMKLITNPTELKTDVLLKLIRSCGSKLRTDDSTALTTIIGELTKSVKANEAKGMKTSTRTRFLIDTITDLKNNRLKNIDNDNTLSMINRLKKQLGSINNGRNLDPIKVNLADIENIEERGKWWLVGSAWKGNADKEEERFDHTENVNDDLINDTDELSADMDVNWMDLARQCRMNTDIRRAIFISIMSAEDFMDAFMKLEKLNLKRSQKAEIPNILMHCATMESTHNPYYSYLAKKLCDDHSMRRSFQLNLWDFVKELDGDESATTILTDATEDERLWKIINMGRFFGFLIGEGSLSLNVLRIVNFLTASSDVKIFLEIMLITVIDTIGKKSEVSGFASGPAKNKKTKDITYSGKMMAERISKCEEQPLLLKGLQYFLNSKLRESGFIKGKKQRSRIEWGVDTMSEMIGDLLKSQK